MNAPEATATPLKFVVVEFRGCFGKLAPFWNGLVNGLVLTQEWIFETQFAQSSRAGIVPFVVRAIPAGFDGFKDVLDHSRFLDSQAVELLSVSSRDAIGKQSPPAI